MGHALGGGPGRHEDRGDRARRGRREVFRKRVPTPRGDYAATIAAIASSGARETGEGSVGIGIPGALSRMTGLVKNANSTWLIGKPLKQDLEKALGRQVRIENDANCFALSEAVGRRGEGREGGVRRDPRHRGGRRDRGGRRGAGGRERHRRRMGPQPAAAADGGRPAAAGLLLRPQGLHRDLSVRSGLSRDHEQDTGERLRRRRSFCTKRALPDTRKGWRARWPG